MLCVLEENKQTNIDLRSVFNVPVILVVEVIVVMFQITSVVLQRIYMLWSISKLTNATITFTSPRFNAM
jgi:hypothetical protein